MELLGNSNQRRARIGARRFTSKIAFAGLLAALLAPAVWAQTAPTPAPSTTATPPPDSDIVKMEAVSVGSVPLEEQIMPTARPFSSVYGFDDDILSVPRNVTIVSTQQMEAIDIQDVTQFSKLTSSSFTDSNFGSPANPSIRGQPADFFTNGMRQHVGDNGDGMPVDFNSLESVNIVPGPATAVQGASAYVGGYVDMITKRPFFDANHGYVSDTVGSYGTERWTIDDGGPINPNLAFRISYSGEDSQGYWYNWLKISSALYVAVTYRPSDRYELFMTANFFDADYRENFGINRPTQALISNGRYQTGTNIDNGTVATPADPQNALNVTGSDTIAWGPVVPVDYHEMAQGPLSHAHGQEYNWQVIQTFKITPELKIVNNTAFGYTKRDTYNSDGYTEEDDPTVFIDNRSELLINLSQVEINTGLEEHWQHVVDYTNFFFEPVNVWDLSSVTLNNDVSFQKSKYFLGTFGNVQVPGWPGRYDTLGTVNNDTNDSELATVSPYIQGTWKVTDVLSVVSGARIDFSHVGDRDPLEVTTPGTSANLGYGEPNANLSLVYRIAPTVSTYATVNFSENYTGALADGGGFGLYTNAAGNATLPRSLFSEESVLYEYGVKTSTNGGKLFTTSDVFYQTRQNKPQGSPAIQYQYYGFETSVNYQPNRNFFGTLGFSWINGSLPASADPFQAYDTNQIPGGPPNPFANPAAYPLTGRLRAPGQPLDLFNAMGQYTFPGGYGIEVNGLVTSPMNNDYWGYLVIPWQYEIDSSLFYKFQKWKLTATVSNLTNQHNWEPSDATYGLEGIVPEPGIQLEVTMKYKF